MNNTKNNTKILLKNYNTLPKWAEKTRRRIHRLICDPRTSRKKTCANCTLYSDASIKFACSKFPKPCYESVNFEICCRSIIMDGFRYNCAESVYTVHSLPKLACRGRERLLQSKRLTSCNASSSGCRRLRTLLFHLSLSLCLCPISVSVSVSVSGYLHLYLWLGCCCGSCRRVASLEVAQIHLSKKREQKETPKRHAGAPRVF